MRAAQLIAIRQFSVQSIPIPEVIRPDDVLINMQTVGICGSDVHYYCEGKIGDQIVRYPFVIGHEGAGTVEKIGEKVASLQKGDRIAIDPALYCGECDQCLAGRENTCRNLLFLGCPGQKEGCLSEYIVLPEKCCFPIPVSMSFEQAVLSEPFAIALYAVEQVGIAPGAKIGILGSGPIGLSVHAALQLKRPGAIYMTDAIDERCALAKKRGATWCGNIHGVDPVKEISKHEPLLLDIVFECCGKHDALQQAVKVLKPGGVLAIIGIPEEESCVLPVHDLRRKEITIKNIRRQNRCTKKAIDIIGSGAVNLDDLVTHHFPLDRINQAFDLVADYHDGVMKAMVMLR
jgi:L-iditol 2-dehydrogenase